MIKLAIAAWCLEARGREARGPETLALAAKLGFDHIQIDVSNRGAKNDGGSETVQRAYRDLAALHRLKITAVGVRAVNDLGMVASPGSAAAHACQERIDAAIDLALAVGANLVFLPAFRASQIHHEKDSANTALQLRRGCRCAADHGLKIASENSLSVEDQIRLVHKVEESNFRLLFDTYNPVLFGQRAADLVPPLAPFLADQIHLKDGIGGHMGSAALGQGEAAFLDTVQALRAADFKGLAVLENKYCQPNGADRLAADRKIAEQALRVSQRLDLVTRGENS